MTFSISPLTRFCLALAVSCVALIVSTQVNASSPQQRDAIAERIAPVGVVCLEGSACHNKPAKPMKVAANTSKAHSTDSKTPYTGRSPQKIYSRYCTACHSSGAAGAPRLGDAKAWRPHVEKGMDTMVSNAIKGIGAMPPKGLCSDCTKAEIQHTTQFMLDNSQ